MKKLAILVSSAIVLLASCSKDENGIAGKGGGAAMTVKTTLSTQVMGLMKDTAINQLAGKMYIMYNSVDTNIMDISATANDSVNTTKSDNGVTGMFSNLKDGSYYVYFKGTFNDTTVHGGHSFYINQSKVVPLYIVIK